MLLRWRRYFAVAAFLLLATPLLVGIVQPDSAASILKEGRYPARGAEAARGPRRLAGPSETD